MPEKKQSIELKGPLYRELVIRQEAIDAAGRTVELAFSSETPVERYFGEEILDHDPSSVRLGRLTDGGPLLLNHDTGCQIGVVESANIGSDRVGRAVVRFGKGAQADEIFQDVVDGIRTKVSVGYQIYSMVLESKDGADNTYRATDWEPMEISIVSVPADNSVGVGRSIDVTSSKSEKEVKMPEEVKETVQQPAAEVREAPKVDVRAIEMKAASEAREKELARIRELETIGDTFPEYGGKELARQMIAEGKNVDDLNAALLARAHKGKPTPTAEIGMTERDVQNYSFVRALNALANPRDQRAQEAAGFEREVSEAAASKSGKEVRGLMVPYDVLTKPLNADVSQRALNVGTGADGGYGVATNLLASSFIDLLRNKAVVAQLGATMLNGLQGNIAIPRQTGAAAFYWVAEAGSATESDQQIDQVTMSPKTGTARTTYSRRLLLQSSLDIEAFVRNDLSKVMALGIDLAALYGSGSSNQPLGIKGTTGINTKTFAADTPTFAELVDMETKLASANALGGNLAYLTNATQRGALKTAPKIGSTYPVFIWDNNEVNGYPAYVSNQVTVGSATGSDVFYGSWSDLVIGNWSGLDLIVDPYTNSSSASVNVNVFQDIDIAVRHAVGFTRGNHNL